MNGRRSKWAGVAAASVAIAALTGCTSTTQTPSPAAVARSAIVADYPRVDGSTTTGPLARLIACDLLGVTCVWSAPASANIERTYVPDPNGHASSPAAALINGTKFSTTHNAYVNLINGTVDVLLEARLPSPDELAEASSHGVELETRAFALDAFVFLVNTDNPTETLPIEALRNVYTGRITTWSAAGIDTGNPADPIHAYQREPNSGSQELMKQMVMGSTAMIDAPDMIVKTMVGPYDAIGGNPTAGAPGDRLGLGFSVYYYAAVMFSNPRVKMIGVGGVKPTPQTISARTYPLAAEVYVVTRKDARPGSRALTYRDWLISGDGQRLVRQSGYVPVAASND